MTGKFTLGKLLATPGAVEAMARCGQDPACLLRRHAAGDWGHLSDDDRLLNEQAVEDGSRILSAYMLGDGQTKVWIITEAEGDKGKRAATTILLPEEY